MWNLENDTNEPICKAGIDTDVKNRHVDTDGERKGGTNWESAIKNKKSKSLHFTLIYYFSNMFLFFM